MDLPWSLCGIISTLLVVSILQWVTKRMNKLKVLKRNGIPGPTPSFFLGNIHQLRGKSDDDVILEWIQKYGNIFGYYIGDVPYVVINDVEILKQIMIKDFASFTDRSEFLIDLPPLDVSLETLKGRRWKEVRAVLSPTFSSAKIKLMTAVVSKKVDTTLKIMDQKTESGEPFDIYLTMQRLTLDVITDCALAMKTNCQEDPHDILLKRTRHFVSCQSNFVTDMMLAFPFLHPLVKRLAMFTPAGRDAAAILLNIRHAIKERMKQSPSSRSVDLLQLMLDCRDAGEAVQESNKSSPVQLSDYEIASNAYLFLLAGQETTSTALAYTFYLLVKHPDIQKRLHSEISSAIDDSYSSLQSLPYLDQVIQESLRIYPPVTRFITRSSDRDYPLNTNETIPKGAKIQSPVWSIHHDPNVWPDPWTFDPDRFQPDTKTKYDLAFQPFGAGPRNCIAARFALLQMKLVLLKLLQKFRFEACEKTEDKISLNHSVFLAQPKTGVWLRAVRRS